MNDAADGDHAVDDPEVTPSALADDGCRRAALRFISGHPRECRLYYLIAVKQSQDGATKNNVAGATHAVVFMASLTKAQDMLRTLKALRITAFAVHERTPKDQVNFGDTCACSTWWLRA